MMSHQIVSIKSRRKRNQTEIQELKSTIINEKFTRGIQEIWEGRKRIGELHGLWVAISQPEEHHQVYQHAHHGNQERREKQNYLKKLAGNQLWLNNLHIQAYTWNINGINSPIKRQKLSPHRISNYILIEGLLYQNITVINIYALNNRAPRQFETKTDRIERSNSSTIIVRDFNIPTFSAQQNN